MSRTSKEYCVTCGREMVPRSGIDPMTIPLSEHHIRCLKCHWPVARVSINENGLCRNCGKKGMNKGKVSTA